MARSNLKPAVQPTAEVSAYKAMLADILAKRPSGTKQRLATRLLKESQVTILEGTENAEAAVPVSWM